MTVNHLKVVEIQGQDGGPAGGFLPLWLNPTEAPPRGAHTLAQGRQILRERGIEGDEADCLLFADSSSNATGRVEAVTVGTERVLVRTTNKPVLGECLSTSQLYDLICMLDDEKRAYQEQEELKNEPPPASAIERLAQLQIGRREGGTPFLVQNIWMLRTLWPGACSNIVEASLPPGDQLVVFAQSYRAYGMRMWPLDSRFEVNPINGDRVSHPLSVAQQTLLTMAALKTMEKILVFTHHGWVPLVEMAEISYYLSAINGPADHSLTLKAFEELIHLLWHYIGAKKVSGIQNYQIEKCLLATIGVLAQVWCHNRPRWNSFFAPAKELGFDALRRVFVPELVEEEEQQARRLEEASAAK